MEKVLEEINRYDIIGIGTGKTIDSIINQLPKNKIYVPSSLRTLMNLKEAGLKTESISAQKFLELYIDGTDFVDKNGSLIKGGGGAVVAEKILMSLSRKNIIIAQEVKFVDDFRDKCVSLHVLKHSMGHIESILNCKKIHYKWRRVNDGFGLYISEEESLIIDITFNIDFLRNCKNISGVIDHGYLDSEIWKYEIVKIK